MPASRTVTFVGRHEDFHFLRSLSERAGRLVVKLKGLEVFQQLAGWRFSTPADLWWAVVFEIAWSGQHPLLRADRRLWLPAEKPTTFLPYDSEQLQRLASSGLSFSVPESWLVRLPDAWVSEIADATIASLDALDYVLSELGSAGDVQPPPSINQADSEENALEHASSMMKRRFAIALSFPGEHRELVSQVADGLGAVFGRERVFYDQYHEAELARPNLDLILQRFYSQDADLIAVFVCGNYNQKEWCGIEWRSIRELMKSNSRLDEDVMFLRLDSESLSGLLSIDGYIDVARKSPREVADAILRRWVATR